MGSPDAKCSWQAMADLVLGALKAEGLVSRATVVLVGSCARGVETPQSDIDIWIIGQDGTQLPILPPADLNLTQSTRRRFVERLDAGDDFPAWALRYGVPLSDPDGWWAAQVKLEAANPHWPDWKRKLVHGVKRLRIARELLETEDTFASAEESLYAA